MVSFYGIFTGLGLAFLAVTIGLYSFGLLLHDNRSHYFGGSYQLMSTLLSLGTDVGYINNTW